VKPARIAAMAQHAVALDLETHLIQPGLVTPPIVVGSGAQADDRKGHLLPLAAVRRIFDTLLGTRFLVLVGANIPFDLMCLAVDYARRGSDVMPAILDMYDPGQGAIRGDVDGRVFDIQVAEQLHAVARGHLGYDPRDGGKMRGRYSLQACVEQVLGRDNAKANDRFRLSYALLESIPIEQWPPEARDYPVDDAVNTLEVALAQTGHMPNVGGHEWVESVGTGGGPHCRLCDARPGVGPECRSTYARQNLHEVSRQCFMDFALKLGAGWGLAVNQAAVDALEAKWDAEHTPESRAPFVAAGILRPDGTENQVALKRLVARAYGATDPCPPCEGSGKVPSPATQGKTKINCVDCNGTGLHLTSDVPRTEKDGVGKGRDVLHESGDELLADYAASLDGRKIKQTYIPWLRGTDKDDVPHPGVPLILRPNVLLETGRVSYDGASQTMPRAGGVRDCIVARPGRVLSSNDYPAGELITHSQSCLWIVGDSQLARALNGGLDAHSALAATTMGLDYEEFVTRAKAGDKDAKNGRQISKPPNFGYPGRMGPAKLAQQQRRQNDVHTPWPDGPSWLDDGKGGKIRGYKGLRFCLVGKRAQRCGEVKVTEWNGRDLGARLCKVCIEHCVDSRKTWLMQWPENVEYFNHVKRVDESGAPVVQHVSKRLRGFKQGVIGDDGEPVNSGNAIANGYFQALLADAAKNAYMACTRECYDPRVRIRSHVDRASRWENGASPLYGSRLPQFQHDEIVGDHPADVASDAAWRIAELMEESLELCCPDMVRAIRGKVRPALMTRLLKGAEEQYGPNGRLVPWEPKK
jgi:DNA polymerase-1